MDQPEGPDLRFVQANERTLLAWVRTSLGLLGLGFVIARARMLLHGMLPGEPPGPERSSSLVEWAGTVIAGLAPLALALGVVRYHRTHQALVERRAPHVSALGPILFAGAVAVAAAAAAVYLVVSSS